MANFTKSRDVQNSPISPVSIQTKQDSAKDGPPSYNLAQSYMTPAATTSPRPYNMGGDEPFQPRAQRERTLSRPLSMVQTYQPPLMDVAQDTLPELQPIFTYLNSHGNKLYQEGYFLKLDDQDNRTYSATLMHGPL
jgi:CCR4-NOT transcriptional complex subunit CAF120